MRVTLPVISMGKYTLRELRLDDYLDYYEIGSDQITTSYVSWETFKKPTDALYVFENIFLKRPSNGLPVGYAICLKSEDKLIGIIDYHTYFSNINCAEVGYILNRKYWNMGIMSKALKCVVDVGFNYLDLDKIVIGHAENNIGSQKVILNNHFQFERKALNAFKDKNNIYHTIFYYSLYRFEYKGD